MWVGQWLCTRGRGGGLFRALMSRLICLAGVKWSCNSINMSFPCFGSVQRFACVEMAPVSCFALTAAICACSVLFQRCCGEQETIHVCKHRRPHRLVVHSEQIAATATFSMSVVNCNANANAKQSASGTYSGAIASIS